jgi:hypothetical protein
LEPREATVQRAGARQAAQEYAAERAAAQEYAAERAAGLECAAEQAAAPECTAEPTAELVATLAAIWAALALSPVTALMFSARRFQPLGLEQRAFLVMRNQYLDQIQMASRL